MKNFIYLNLILNLSVFTIPVISEESLRPAQEYVELSVWAIGHQDAKDVGTGFFVAPNLVVTNFHVIDQWLLEDYDVNRMILFKAEDDLVIKVKNVISLSALYDLALVEVETSDHPYLGFRLQTPFSEEELFVTGSPDGHLEHIKKTGPILFLGEEYSFSVNHSDLSEHYIGV